MTRLPIPNHRRGPRSNPTSPKPQSGPTLQPNVLMTQATVMASAQTQRFDDAPSQATVTAHIDGPPKHYSESVVKSL